MAWSPSASRASPSTSPIAISPPSTAASSSPIRPAMFSTPATWRPAPRPPISRSCLVDAQAGMLTQTRRHAYIASLLGIRHVVLAVNKIDLVDFDQARFERIRADFADFAKPLNFREIVAIPMSARHGDNVIAPSHAHALVHRARRFCRSSKPSMSATPTRSMRSACRCSGSTAPTALSAVTPARSPPANVRPGDRVVVARSGKDARVASIVTHGRRARQRIRRRGDYRDPRSRGRYQPWRHSRRADGRARKYRTRSPRI